MIDISAYLRRIRYNGPLQTNFETLRVLQLAHLYSVPFENLDIARKRPIALDEASLFNKIVIRRCGGFCYELNGLFASLLALGFDVTYLSASDAHADGSYSPEFDHLLLLIRAASLPDEAWLADVGWGDTFCEPLVANKTDEQLQNGRVYWLELLD